MTTLSITRISFLILITCALGACGGGSSSKSVSFSTFQSATVEIGQADFSGHQSNQGGAADANTLNQNDGDVAVSGGTLFVPDWGNNRILGFNGIPTVNNQTADFVLNQPDFTTTTAGTDQSGLYAPESVYSDGSQLFVADYLNNRVLIYSSVPTSGPVDASVAVGQATLSATSQACTRTGMYRPTDVTVANGKLIVADAYNNRVLIYNTLPATSGAQASLVLGQNDFSHCVVNNDTTGNVGSATAASLDQPTGVWTDGTRLVVADIANNRVLIWTSFPTQNQQPADLVLGQYDFTHAAANDDNHDGATDLTPSNRTLHNPYFVTSNGHNLIVSDNSNHRVLIWNHFPTQNFQPADVVLGQSDFTHNTYNDDNQDGTVDAQASDRTMQYPSGVRMVGHELFVTDEGNNRVLVFKEH